MALPSQLDHVELGLSRILSQWENSPNIQGLIKSFLEQSNQLETVLFEILNQRGINEAIGVQLDVIGSLFGVDRAGMTDDQYRAEILQTISLIETDGTTEIFMQVMRTISGSNFVDFWEHPSGDVHAILGDGFDFNTYPKLEDLVPAGVNLRIHVDSEFDSFVPTELLSEAFILETNVPQNINVTTNGTDIFNLEVQLESITAEGTEKSILPELVDNRRTPFLAELLWTEVKTITGQITDNNNNPIVDNNGNSIFWVDYTF